MMSRSGMSQIQKIIGISVVFIGILMVKIKKDQIIAPSINNSKVFFLGPGCGHLSYTMGFVAGLLDDDILRNEIKTKNAKFGGLSSGAITGSFAMATLNDVGTMDEWYETRIRPAIQGISEKTVFGLHDILANAVVEVYDAIYLKTKNEQQKTRSMTNQNDDENVLKENDASTTITTKTVVTTTTHDDIGDDISHNENSEITTTTKTTKTISLSDSFNTPHQFESEENEDIPWLKDFPIAVTYTPSIKPVLFTTFPKKEDFIKIIHASAYVPGMMGYRPWLYYQGHRVIDGFPGSLSIIWPDNYMFISFLPMQPLIFLGKHQLPQYQYDSTPGFGIVGFLRKFWPWGNLQWHDDCYKRGKLDVKKNLGMYRERIIAFLNDEN